MAALLPSRLSATVGLEPVPACSRRVIYRRVRRRSWKEIRGRADNEALMRARRVRSRKSTRRGLRLLRRLVPNGEPLELGALVREAADYVERLQARVGVLRATVKSLSDSAGRV